MNQQPKLSIVIPVYNVERYLTDTIDSIITQNFDDYEAIFVNDGSTDSCPALLNSAQEKYPNKIRVIHLKENGGTHFARKAGVIEARGNYLTFLDGDDYFLPNAFSTMINEMENNPADILRFNVAFNATSEETQAQIRVFYVVIPPPLRYNVVRWETVD